MDEPDYDNPTCFQEFHECSEQKQWELYRDIRARLAAAEAALAEANRRLAEIRDELCGNNLDVVGWHLNGDLEPLDTWWEDNEWGPVEAAKGGRDE